MSERTPKKELPLSELASDGKLLSEEELRAALHSKGLSEEQRQALLHGWQRLARSSSPAGLVARMGADPAFPRFHSETGHWQRRYLVLKYLVQRLALGKKVMFIFKFII